MKDLKMTYTKVTVHYTAIQSLGSVRIVMFFFLMELYLFDQKYRKNSNIVKYYCSF